MDNIHSQVLVDLVGLYGVFVIQCNAILQLLYLVELTIFHNLLEV
jgi:hypothetical protein